MARKAQEKLQMKQDQEAAQRSTEALRRQLFSGQSGAVWGKGGTKRKSEAPASGQSSSKTKQESKLRKNSLRVSLSHWKSANSSIPPDRASREYRG